MALTVTDQAALDLVIDRLNRITGLDQSGAVTLGTWGGEFDTSIEIVAGCVDYSQRLPTRQRLHITRRAVIDAKKADELTPAGFLKRATLAEVTFLQSTPQKYVLLSTVSLQELPIPAKVRLEGATFAFSRTRPASFAHPPRSSSLGTHPYPVFVKVHVTAREPFEAADIAFDRMDLLRAIWNLAYNRRMDFRISFGGLSSQPVNTIHFGPLHTLHLPSGKLTPQADVWHTPHLEGIKPVSLRDGMERIRKFERWVRTRLKEARARDLLRELLQRYGRALDEVDLNASLTALWAVLEGMTGSRKGSYEDVIRRTAFFTEDPPFHKLVLEHIKDQRNQIVHRGVSAEDPERLLYTLKRYVEFILIFLLRKSREFGSLDEFKTLTSLPTAIEDLKAALRLHRMAYAIRVTATKEPRE